MPISSKPLKVIMPTTTATILDQISRPPGDPPRLPPRKQRLPPPGAAAGGRQKQSQSSQQHASPARRPWVSEFWPWRPARPDRNCMRRAQPIGRTTSASRYSVISARDGFWSVTASCTRHHPRRSRQARQPELDSRSPGSRALVSAPLLVLNRSGRVTHLGDRGFESLLPHRGVRCAGSPVPLYTVGRSGLRGKSGCGAVQFRGGTSSRSEPRVRFPISPATIYGSPEISGREYRFDLRP